MPRLITCVDQSFGEEPLLDSAAFWVRLPDGTRAADPAGKLLAFKYRENAGRLASELGGKAVPPEVHEMNPSGAGIPARQASSEQHAGKNARATE